MEGDRGSSVAVHVKQDDIGTGRGAAFILLFNQRNIFFVLSF